MMLKCRWMCKLLCQFPDNYSNIVECKSRRDKSKQVESYTGVSSEGSTCFFAFLGHSKDWPRGPPFVPLVERQKHEMEDQNGKQIS